MKEELFAEMADIVEQVCAQRGADTVESLVICEAVFDQLFKKHQEKRQDVIGNDDMKEVNTLLYTLTGDPVLLLPIDLQCMLECPEAFRESVRHGLFKISRGRIVPKVQKKVLLAYLLGRLFSGDYPEGKGRFQMWAKGEFDFPSTGLERYFRVENLRQSRQKNLEFGVPKGHKLIDVQFVKGETF